VSVLYIVLHHHTIHVVMWLVIWWAVWSCVTHQ